MQSINRFLYGPTPEERVRNWQGKLRGQQRELDREIRNVCPAPNLVYNLAPPSLADKVDRPARDAYPEIPNRAPSTCEEE